MKKILFLVLGVFTLLVFSCSNNKEFVPVLKGGFGGDWLNLHTLGKYGGLNGELCSKIDSINKDSYGLRKLLSEICPNTIKKIKISVWVKVEDINKKAKLAISLSSKNKNIFWEDHEINSIIKEANKWYKFEFEKTLPEYEVEGAQIETYIFNSDKNVVYVDDFQIRFFEE